MKKNEIKLPKELHGWLADLKRSLKKLNDEDRDDILLSYVEQFSEELNEGKTLEQIQGELRSIPEIVAEIYQEFNVDTIIKIKDKKKQKIVKVKISRDNEPEKMKTPNKVISIFSFLLSLGMWVLIVVIGAIAVLFPIAIVVGVTLSYINFDIYYATGLAVIFLGVLPLVGTFLFFSTKGLYRASVKMVKPFKQNPKKFGIKLWLILLIVSGVLSALILGIGVGTTYRDGFLDYTVNNKYQHTQELLDINSYEKLVEKINQDNEKEVKVDALKEYFEAGDLESRIIIESGHYWKKVVSESKNPQGELMLKVKRHFNLKEEYKLNPEDIKIKVSFAPNNKIGSLEIVLPDLEWFNYLISGQPETIEFIYN